MVNRTQYVLADIRKERQAQDKKWGSQRDHPDGTRPELYGDTAQVYRQSCDTAFAQGNGTWRHILLEEVYEALSETDPARLREELVQVAAVCTVWVEALDARMTHG